MSRRGGSDEQEEVRMLRGHHDDHDVGDAGDGQRDEGRIDDGDEQQTGDAEGEQRMNAAVGFAGVVSR